LALDESLKAQPQVLHHAATEVASGGGAALVAEHVEKQRAQVARVRREVVEPVRRETRVPEAAQVGDDHLEARIRERADVAPPDALRLGPTVYEQQGVAAGSLADIGDAQPRTH